MRRRTAPTLSLPRDHANRGRWFQRLLNDACRRYQDEDRAYIAEIPTPMQPRAGYRGARSRSGQHMEAFYTRKGSPDFLGFAGGHRTPRTVEEWGAGDHLHPIGIAFDAKSTLGHEWSSSVAAHQLAALSLIASLGHIAGIMVGFMGIGGEMPSAVWVPYPACNMLASGRWRKQKLLELSGTREINWTGWLNFLEVIL